MSSQRVTPRPGSSWRTPGSWTGKRCENSIRTVHKKQDRYTCRLCGRLVGIGARTRHERMHSHARPETVEHKCMVCGKLIAEEAQLPLCIGCEHKDPYFLEMEQRLASVARGRSL